MDRRTHRTIYLKHCLAGLGILTLLYYGNQGPPLPFSRPLVNNGLERAVSLMNGTRPRISGDGPQAIKPDITVISLFDIPRCKGATGSVRGKRIELTRATEVTVAIDEMPRCYAPCKLAHDTPSK
jgi:hypothetical protein